jgi:hypothetical protein
MLGILDTCLVSVRPLNTCLYIFIKLIFIQKRLLILGNIEAIITDFDYKFKVISIWFPSLNGYFSISLIKNSNKIKQFCLKMAYNKILKNFLA